MAHFGLNAIKVEIGETDRLLITRLTDVLADLAKELHEYNNPKDLIELRGDDGAVRTYEQTPAEWERSHGG